MAITIDIKTKINRINSTHIIFIMIDLIISYIDTCVNTTIIVTTHHCPYWLEKTSSLLQCILVIFLVFQQIYTVIDTVILIIDVIFTIYDTIIIFIVMINARTSIICFSFNTLFFGYFVDLL
jgi:hypothetical protein